MGELRASCAHLTNSGIRRYRAVECLGCLPLGGFTMHVVQLERCGSLEGIEHCADVRTRLSRRPRHECVVGQRPIEGHSARYAQQRPSQQSARCLIGGAQARFDSGLRRRAGTACGGRLRNGSRRNLSDEHDQAQSGGSSEDHSEGRRKASDVPDATHHLTPIDTSS